LYEPEKPKAVSLPDAVAYPRAVVVMGGDTMVTVLAVLGSQRLLNVADGAVLVLDEEDNVFLILWLLTGIAWLIIFEVNLDLSFDGGFLEGLLNFFLDYFNLLFFLSSHFPAVWDVKLDVEGAIYVQVVDSLRGLKIVELFCGREILRGLRTKVESFADFLEVVTGVLLVLLLFHHLCPVVINKVIHHLLLTPICLWIDHLIEVILPKIQLILDIL
jgi:hypothetical protein